jgi:hypothetical protein
VLKKLMEKLPYPCLSERYGGVYPCDLECTPGLLSLHQIDQLPHKHHTTSRRSFVRSNSQYILCRCHSLLAASFLQFSLMHASAHLHVRWQSLLGHILVCWIRKRKPKELCACVCMAASSSANAN